MNKRRAASFCPLCTTPNFRGLLDGVAGVPASICKAHHLGFGRLSLEQIGGEVGCIEGMFYAPYDAPSTALNHLADIAFQSGAKGVIRSKKEPRIPARLRQCPTCSVG